MSFYYEPKDDDYFETNYCPTCIKKLEHCPCDRKDD